MTYIVTENCQDCRFTDCVTVCPVDCFHGDERMLYIDPDECIDCGVCAEECPVGAICDEVDLPEGNEFWIEVNAARSLHLPLVTPGEFEPASDSAPARLKRR